MPQRRRRSHSPRNPHRPLDLHGGVAASHAEGDLGRRLRAFAHDLRSRLDDDDRDDGADAYAWVDWAFRWGGRSSLLDHVLTDADWLAVRRLQQAASVVGEVTYAQFFVRTLLHRLAVRFPTWTADLRLDDTLWQILDRYDGLLAPPAPQAPDVVAGGGRAIQPRSRVTDRASPVRW